SEQKSTQEKNVFPPDTKPIRGSRTLPPVNPFQPGNQHALKHGGYARRFLLKDEVVEDARALTLEDELFRLRANNLMAAENIGRWLTLLEDAEEERQRKILMDNISAAENAMMRNTARIESIERTLAMLDIIAVTPAKIIADTEYRTAAREKVKAETDILTSQKQGVTTPMAEIVSALHGMSHSGRLDDIPEE
ncbi:hypothetical protein AAL83_003370, partial [Salmonella enterica subsp. enterica serovar Eko]|nr:hypothetical protein [Salmonella enterica subsp. enterica serovar Eko]